MMRPLALIVFAFAGSADAQTPPTCGRLALALVVDRSGSMTGQKLDNAKAAASAAVDRLTADDCVTVIAFDSSPTTVVAIHPVNDPAAVKTAIAGIQAAGGTQILNALTAGHDALKLASRARKKHLVLLTDGQAPNAGLSQLAQTMSGEHMTLSTIGLGSDVDEAMLRTLASTASGRYYGVHDATMLARIFTREIDLVLAP